MTGKLQIRQAVPNDLDAIWDILKPVIRAGETYPFPRDMGRDAALAYWLSPSHQTFIAELDDEILGTYYIRPNNQGGGAHVANCGYVTGRNAQGKGVASAMCTHSIEFARTQDFTAMQFNFVVASNIRAVALWEKLGFKTLCSLPNVFNHPKYGLVDALVMFKALY